MCTLTVKARGVLTTLIVIDSQAWTDVAVAAGVEGRVCTRAYLNHLCQQLEWTRSSEKHYSAHYNRQHSIKIMEL